MSNEIHLTQAERDLVAATAIAARTLDEVTACVEQIVADRLAPVIALADQWIGFEDSHEFGDQLLKVVTR